MEKVTAIEKETSMEKEELTIRTKFQTKVKSTCENLTPKQRKAAVFALLFILMALCLMSIADAFQGNGYEFRQERISPLTIPKNNNNGTK